MSGSRVLHYEIVRPLGRGGMGEVVEAIDTRLGRHVALKFVAEELAADDMHRERFEREARAAAGLTHPNIAVVHAFESHAGRMFLVMELLSGHTLRALVSGGALPVPQALRIARELASALAFAHSRSIHHRDVKPENVMFDEHGAAKLMDFGLAYAANTTRLTRTHTTLGTPAYMAPEAIAGQSEPVSDVFALGVVLHEMLAGSPPFSGENAMSLMYAISTLPPRPLLEARPEAGEAIAALVARMLEKAPQARITAAQAVRELDALMGGAPAATSLVDPEARTQELPTPTPGALMPAGVSADAKTLDLSVERVAAPEQALVPRPRAGARSGWRLGVIVLALAVASGLAWRWRAGALSAAHERALHESDAGTEALLAHDLRTAAAHFDAALQLDPRLWAAHIGRAALDAEQGDRTAAATRLQRVLGELRKDDHALRAAVWSHLAEIAIADGNWNDAVLDLRSAFAEDSSEAGVYNQLGFALIHSGAAPEAAQILDRGLARFPGVAALHKNAGLAALANGSPERAAAAADAALERDPAYAPAFALRARARARLGNRSGATADALRALAPGALDAASGDELLKDLALQGITLAKDPASGEYRESSR